MEPWMIEKLKEERAEEFVQVPLYAPLPEYHERPAEDEPAAEERGVFTIEIL